MKTLQDFSSISKSVKLSNLFLTSFAELAAEQESPDCKIETTLLKLDILIAMMEKVKLKRENYLTLMSGVKVFLRSGAAQKRAYKLLAKVIEKYELTSVDEL